MWQYRAPRRRRRLLDAAKVRCPRRSQRRNADDDQTYRRQKEPQHRADPGNRQHHRPRRRHHRPERQRRIAHRLRQLREQRHQVSALPDQIRRRLRERQKRRNQRALDAPLRILNRAGQPLQFRVSHQPSGARLRHLVLHRRIRRAALGNQHIRRPDRIRTKQRCQRQVTLLIRQTGRRTLQLTNNILERTHRAVGVVHLDTQAAHDPRRLFRRRGQSHEHRFQAGSSIGAFDPVVAENSNRCAQVFDRHLV